MQVSRRIVDLLSHVSLKMYEDAARHILDALVLQENDASREEGVSGLSNSTLWDTLKSTCMFLHRQDLATLCDAKDLAGKSTIYIFVVAFA